VGRDFAEITRSANYNVFIGRDEAEVAERRAQYVERLRPHLSEEQLAGQLRTIDGLPGVGTPEQIVEKLRAVGELGMEYGIFYFPEAAYDRSGIDLFASEVIPALR